MFTKKIAVTVFAAVCALALSASAQNTTLDYTISVSVAADPIDLAGITDQVSFGIGGFGQTLLSNFAQGQPRSTVQNRGYSTVDYTARAAISQGAWTLGSTPGNNVASLYAIFTQALTESDNPTSGRDVAIGDFGSEDLLGSTAIRASDTVLAQNSETGVEIKGNRVFTTQSVRSLRYRLDLPTSGDTSPQVLTVTIGAVAL